MTALQAFKTALVPNRKVRLLAHWTPPEGEERTVHIVRSKDVGFQRPDGRVSWLRFPKTPEVTQNGPHDFTIRDGDVPNDNYQLRYMFSEV